MNVQTPQNQVDQGDYDDEPGLLARAGRYLIGAAAIGMLLGGYWYFTHTPADDAARRRDPSAPVKVAVAVGNATCR